MDKRESAQQSNRVFCTRRCAGLRLNGQVTTNADSSGADGISFDLICLFVLRVLLFNDFFGGALALAFETRLVLEIPHLRRFARSLARDQDEADDLLQTVLERALAKGHLIRKPGSLRSWLFRIMYNSHLNIRQKASSREIATDFQNGTGAVASNYADQERQLEVADVLAALQRLPLDQRAAITLTAVEDLTYAEAAKVLDIPQGTLMSRIYRGRQALRRLTEENGLSEQQRPTLHRVK